MDATVVSTADCNDSSLRSSNQKKWTPQRRGVHFLVRAAGLEPTVSWSQRGSNLVLHVHELHLTLSAPENLLSGALFSAASTSSKGGCGQTCGRMETLPWNAADSPLPGSVWIVALFHRKVKSLESLSAHSFCVAVDKEIRRAGLTSAWVLFCQRDNYSRQNEK